MKTMSEQQALSWLRRSLIRLADARNNRNEAMIALHIAGMPVAEIAAVAGLSRQRVYQIIRL